VWGRSVHDREILRLAVPALGALTAEPLYLLVDTAIVGHLGTPQLAALALAGTLLAGAVTMCNFLTYGTTAQTARLHGAGAEEQAGALAAQSGWLALGLGLLLAVIAAALAPELVTLMGGEGRVADGATDYLRISSIGIPAALVALAGQGFLRGVGDLRTPLLVVVAAHAANVALEVLFVYGLDLGLPGSAWGTVLAQLGMGGAFALLLFRAPAATRRLEYARMRPLLRVGGDIFVRTAALLGCFTVASAVLARVGSASLAAHQIAFQLFIFLALVLDALAIAGQVIVGRMLGGADAPGARAAARRMLEWSLVVGVVFAGVLLVLSDVLPRVFTDDPRVLARAHEMWPLFALMQPFGAVVFALDGVLIGAGDTRYLMWSMVAAAALFVPVCLLTLRLDWGIVGVWGGLLGLMLVRLATLGARFRTERWAVTGAPA
jgi:putative MATE family efflux protein